VPGVGGAGGGPEQSGSNREVAEALLAAGADPNAEHQGYRLLGFAINLGPEWVQLFLHHRADPNRRPIGGGDTPLEAIQRYRTQGRPAALTMESLAESERLLRAAGARDDVPDFSAIKVARKSANYVQAVFRSGATNDPNRFTLFELLATHYGAMTAPLAFRGVDPAAGGGGLGGPPGFAPAGPPRVGRPAFASREVGLGFTDWRRVVIYRAAKQGLNVRSCRSMWRRWLRPAIAIATWRWSGVMWWNCRSGTIRSGRRSRGRRRAWASCGNRA
jgi:hypothetical protein